MAESERNRLTNVDAAHARRNNAADDFEELFLALHLKLALKFRIAVEMIFNGTLVAAGDKDHFRHAGGGSFFKRILNEGLVDDREHFLRHRLGGRKEAGAETINGEDYFTDGLHMNSNLEYRGTGAGHPPGRCRFRMPAHERCAQELSAH